MGKCIIVCAGDFREQTIPYEQGDLLIAADAGYVHLRRLGISPDLLLGDFDSLGEGFLEPMESDIEILRLPVEKDDTDCMAAVRVGLGRGFLSFLLLGALGGERPDHMLANLQTLLFLKRSGASGVIRDGAKEFQIIENETLCFPSGWSGDFSLFAVDRVIRGVTIRGMKYELEDAAVTNSFPIGVSNSFCPDKEAKVTVREGAALIYTNYSTRLKM